MKLTIETISGMFPSQELDGKAIIIIGGNIENPQLETWISNINAAIVVAGLCFLLGRTIKTLEPAKRPNAFFSVVGALLKAIKIEDGNQKTEMEA